MRRKIVFSGLLLAVLLFSTRAAAQSNVDVKRTTVYAGIGYSFPISKLHGLTGIIGGIYHNHDLQLNYTFGIGKTQRLYWYDSNGDMESALAYKRNSLGMKYGYQIRLRKGLALTPQLGFSYERLNARQEMGSKDFGHGANAWCTTVGMKLCYMPIKYCTLFLSTEHKIPMCKNAYYKDVLKKTDNDEGGFVIHLGLITCF